MKFGGRKVPYVEVARAFARNPSAYAYDITPLARGGGRITNKRLEPVETPIPVVFSRRGNEDKSWDNIKTELAGILYGNKYERLSFTHGDGKYYKAQIVAIEFTDEQEYAAKGNIVFVSEEPCRFGSDITIEVSSTSEIHEIHGQIPTPWASKTIFDVDADQYTLEAGRGLYVELNYDFVSGDVLHIDSHARIVRLNGKGLATSMGLNTEWNKGELATGRVSLKASHETEITYTERYH